jgi:hypothetical protein
LAMPSGIGLLLLVLLVPGLLLIVAIVVASFFRRNEADQGMQVADDGPGRYRIAGSGDDGREISTIIEADSWADACRQAEDRGIEVTVVQRLAG